MSTSAGLTSASRKAPQPREWSGSGVACYATALRKARAISAELCQESRHFSASPGDWGGAGHVCLGALLLVRIPFAVPCQGRDSQYPMGLGDGL